MRRLGMIMILLVLLTSALPVNASGSSARWEGTMTAQAGNTVTLDLVLTDADITSFTGKLQYDPEEMVLVNVAQSAPQPWEVSFSGSVVAQGPDNMQLPQSGLAIFSVTFRLEILPAGTQLPVSFQSQELGTVSTTITVLPTHSAENRLASLSAENTRLTPEFQPDRTEYTATVPYHVTALVLSYTAMDENASVTVENNAILPGATTDVTIKVTAEDGSVRIYTIAVTAEQSPGYVPAANADVSGITVDGFLLSPGFSPEVTEYVVWLPYETEEVTVSAVPADPKASVQIIGGKDLKPGQDNKVHVLCTAEDGTQKVYTVIAKRAAAHSGATDPAPTITESTAETVPENRIPEQEPVQIPWWIYVVATIAVGTGVAGFIMQRKQ